MPESSRACSATAPAIPLRHDAHDDGFHCCNRAADHDGPHGCPLCSATWRTPATPDWDIWEDIAVLTAWLDSHNGRGEHEEAMRLMKIGAEVGEVMDAYAGERGQNPRKGVTHTRDDICAELSDVIMTALNALALFAGGVDEARVHLRTKVQGQLARVGFGGPNHKVTMTNGVVWTHPGWREECTLRECVYEQEHRSPWQQRAAAAEERIDNALTRHPRDTDNPLGPWCPTCLAKWPCDTVLDLAAPAPETDSNEGDTS